MRISLTLSTRQAPPFCDLVYPLAMTTVETTLSIVPASDDRQRLAVVLCYDKTTGSRLELREQSWGDGVGWFTQRSFAVEPGQIRPLRAALGSSTIGTHGGRPIAQRLGKTFDGRFMPRVIHAESA